MLKLIKRLFFPLAIIFIGASFTGAYFSDSVSVSGNTFETGIWPTTARVVINEVYYDVDSAHGDEGTNEWIELYNPSSTDINIKNWSIADNSGVAHPINANVSIPASGFALLSHDNNTWHLWGDPSGANIITVNLGGSPGSGWLDDSGDRVILKDNVSNIIDQMSYSSGTEGHSWERSPKGTGAFIDNAIPTPGS